MKKMNESGRTNANQNQAGNTSQTGTNVLDRTIINTPQNETLIRSTSLPRIKSVFGDEFVDKAIKEGIVVVI